MEKALDSINIELQVQAVLSDSDIWMHGSLEITINGKKPYFESDIIDLAVFLKSLEADGEYFIFSCCCGVPECGGWTEGIKVSHQGGIVEWIDNNNKRSWHLDKNKMEEDLKTLREEVTVFKKYFKQKKIEYVGVGYNW